MPVLPSWLTDPLWHQFSALLPEPPTYDPGHPLGCHRPRISDRIIFDKMLQRVPQNQVPGGVMHAQRRAVQLVEQPSDPRWNVGRQVPGTWRRLAREEKQVLTLGCRQPQGTGQRGQDLRRRGSGPALFQAGDVVHRQAGELGQFLAAQSGGPTYPARGRSDRGGGDPVPPAMQGLCPVPWIRSPSQYRAATPGQPGTAGPLAEAGTACSSAVRRRWRHHRPTDHRSEHMTTTLITGANKGLGFEAARRLIEAGHTVYVGARDAHGG
jgi:hypothetical protein